MCGGGKLQTPSTFLWNVPETNLLILAVPVTCYAKDAEDLQCNGLGQRRKCRWPAERWGLVMGYPKIIQNCLWSMGKENQWFGVISHFLGNPLWKDHVSIFFYCSIFCRVPGEYKQRRNFGSFHRDLTNKSRGSLGFKQQALGFNQEMTYKSYTGWCFGTWILFPQ